MLIVLQSMLGYFVAFQPLLSSVHLTQPLNNDLSLPLVCDMPSSIDLAHNVQKNLPKGDSDSNSIKQNPPKGDSTSKQHQEPSAPENQKSQPRSV